MALQDYGRRKVVLDLDTHFDEPIYGKSIDNIKTLEVYIVKSGVPQNLTGIDVQAYFSISGTSYPAKSVTAIDRAKGKFDVVLPRLPAGIITAEIILVENQNVLGFRNFFIIIEDSPAESTLGDDLRESNIALLAQLAALKNDFSNQLIMETHAPAKPYKVGNKVSKDGNSYYCIADTTTTPPGSAWLLFAQKGADGINGEVTTAAMEAYVAGQIATIPDPVFDSSIVNAKDYGAVGNGITDDTAALIAARDFVRANGGTFYIPANMNCKVVGSLDLTLMKNVKIDGAITGSLATDIITFGGHFNIAPTNFYFNQVTGAILKLTGIANGNIVVNLADELFLWADGATEATSAIAYSTFRLGKVTKLKFDNISGAAGLGWINSNAFYGGRILSIVMQGEYMNDDNKFYGCQYEALATSPPTPFTAYIASGAGNMWYDCRFEGQCEITFLSGTHDNRFFQSYLSHKGAYLRNIYLPTVTDYGTNNFVIADQDLFYHKEVLYEINPHSYNYNTDVFNRTANAIGILANDALVFDTGVIPIKESVGYFLDCSVDAKFTLTVRGYDASGNLVTAEQTDFVSGAGWSFGGGYYSSWAAIPNTYEGIYIQGVALFETSVIKYYRVEVRTAAGVAGGGFAWMRILKTQPKHYMNDYKPMLIAQRLNGSAAPSSGTWEIGTRVYNNVPASGGYIGWVYTAAGWKGFGTIA